jgi:threonine dehydratase
MVLVHDAAILSARRELAAALPFAVEHSAAAAWAAMRNAPAGAGAIGFILTGGNLPPSAD